MPKPPLYDVVDKLYHAVVDRLPQFFGDRAETTAFVLGAAGIYGVVRGLQWTSKNVMVRIILNFDKKWLPNLEKVCIVGMVTVPVVYAAINPKSAKKIITQHPTYTSGMAGVYAGSIAGALQDLHNRLKTTTLTDRL